MMGFFLVGRKLKDNNLDLDGVIVENESKSSTAFDVTIRWFQKGNGLFVAQCIYSLDFCENTVASKEWSFVS
jgi:hypothetical protein